MFFISQNKYMKNNKYKVKKGPVIVNSMTILDDYTKVKVLAFDLKTKWAVIDTWGSDMNIPILCLNTKESEYNLGTVITLKGFKGFSIWSVTVSKYTCIVLLRKVR